MHICLRIMSIALPYPAAHAQSCSAHTYAIIISLSLIHIYRYIEKQAMDMRTSRREVAECVIRTYSA